MNSPINLYLKSEKHGYIPLWKDAKGELRQLIVIETQEAKRYAGFTMMGRDIDLVMSAIDQLSVNKQLTIIQQSLFFFAVVTYTKCFASNRANRPKLDFKDIFKDADDALKDEHTHILKLRNDYVAHAGAEFDKCLVIGTVIDLDFTVGFNIGCQLSQPINMSPKLDGFKRLCKFVKSMIQIKIDKSLKQVMEATSEIGEQEFENIVITPDTNAIYKMEVVDEQDGDKVIQTIFVKA